TDAEVSSTTENEDVHDTVRSQRAMEVHCLHPLATYVDLLMDLCPTLEQKYHDMHKSNPRRLPRPLQENVAVTPAAMPYVTNVRDKFPQANQELVKRLGEANWQRHERLRALQAHGPASEPQAVQDSKSVFQDSALGSSIRTRSQRAESVASHSSFVSSIGGEEKGHFKVPGLPHGASYGSAIPCPF